MRSFMDRIVTARIGETENFYRYGNGAALRVERLECYLAERREALWLLVGEAPGYRGARVSGLPFTSERQLTGTGPAEATATVVQRVLAELELTESVLLWNVVPTHPGTATSNRPPTRTEVAQGRVFAEELARGRRVICAGRVAQTALGGAYVRHPSHGGAATFAEMLRALLAPATISPRRTPVRRFSV
jgi:uracil-DNA glycosylase